MTSVAEQSMIPHPPVNRGISGTAKVQKYIGLAVIVPDADRGRYSDPHGADRLVELFASRPLEDGLTGWTLAWRSILYRGLTRYRDTTVEWLKTYDDGKPEAGPP